MNLDEIILNDSIYDQIGPPQLVLVVKNLPANVEVIGDTGSMPGLGRSPGGGNGNPLQYFCLGNLWTEEPGRLQSIGLQRVGHD